MLSVYEDIIISLLFTKNDIESSKFEAYFFKKVDMYQILTKWRGQTLKTLKVLPCPLKKMLIHHSLLIGQRTLEPGKESQRGFL